MRTKSLAVADMAFRLLELEQRFESYCALYDEEMNEIRTTLSSLRAQILDTIEESQAAFTADEDSNAPAARPAEDNPDRADSDSVLAL